MYQVLWPLKRLDANAEHIFVTNYWVSVRYPWADVEQFSETKVWFRRLMQLRLKAPGRFGQEMVFIPGSSFRKWMEEQGKSRLIK